MKWFKKKKTAFFSVEDKAVADKILEVLGASHSDSVLEIFRGQSLLGQGVYEKFGCQVRCTETAAAPECGEFEFVILLNLAIGEISNEIISAVKRLSPDGRIILLNTDNPISAADYTKITSKSQLIFCTPVCTEGFSFMVSEKN